VDVSGSRRREDARIGRAAEFLLRCQGAKVPEAMRAVKFTLKESANATKQMAVRRTYAKAIGGRIFLNVAVADVRVLCLLMVILGYFFFIWEAQ